MPKIRVLYSFPHKIGADRICYTAWQQVNGLAKAGADVLLFPGVVHRPLPDSVRVRPTLAKGKLRIPYKLVGTMRACALHDHIVARRLKKLGGQVDIVHTWPIAAEETLKVANEMGIPTVLERPNAHTRFAYETYARECEKLGVAMPPGHEYSFKADVLEKEEREYRLAFRILCPSDFVVKTFLDQGFQGGQLVRHTYGFDEKRFYPDDASWDQRQGLTILSVGVQAVKKGLHYALEAWLKSPAHSTGTFLIAGSVLPAYAEKLKTMLAHPSVHLLGHRNDVPELMRKSDAMVLPSIEEGFGLVCVEALGSGCVPLVSEACTDACRHMENALVHPVGDVAALTAHITTLYQDRALLKRLRDAGIRAAPKLTWDAAGRALLDAYRSVIAAQG
jgi:glycosyltransferase involved in cell wall biosynthesis